MTLTTRPLAARRRSLKLTLGLPSIPEYLNDGSSVRVRSGRGNRLYTRGLSVTTTIRLAIRRRPTRRCAVASWTTSGGRRSGGPEGYVELPAPPKDGKETKESKEALAEAIETAFSQFPDADDLLTAVVLEASPKRDHHPWRRRNLHPGRRGDRFVRKCAGRKRLVRRAPAPWRCAAHDAGRKGRPAPDAMPQVEAALVALDPNDGAVRSLVGGFDFGKNQYNHVTQASRQPGSSFKPFIYSAALEKGITSTTVINDAPLFFPAAQTGGEDWEPKNYDGKSSRADAGAYGAGKSKTWSPSVCCARSGRATPRTTSPSSALTRSSTRPI